MTTSTQIAAIAARPVRRALRRAPELVACSLATRRELEAALGRSDVRFIPYLTPDLASTAVVTGSGQREASAALREELGLALQEL